MLRLFLIPTDRQVLWMSLSSSLYHKSPQWFLPLLFFPSPQQKLYFLPSPIPLSPSFPIPSLTSLLHTSLFPKHTSCSGSFPPIHLPQVIDDPANMNLPLKLEQQGQDTLPTLLSISSSLFFTSSCFHSLLCTFSVFFPISLHTAQIFSFNSPLVYLPPVITLI